MLSRFIETWDRWHLNDMRAGCEHQRSLDTTRKVEVVTYKLTSEALRFREQTLKEAARAALAGEGFHPTPQARALAAIDDWFKDIHQAPDADSPLSGCYEVAKREQKAVGWVTQEEHPDGMLSRPCPTCGYKYGSAWLHRGRTRRRAHLPGEPAGFAGQACLGVTACAAGPTRAEP